MQTRSPKVLIAIPSKRRAAQFFGTQGSFRVIAPLHLDWRLFLEPSDAPAYHAQAPEGLQLPVVLLPLENQGLGYALIRVKQYALDNGYDYVFKMDDDVFNWAMPSRSQRVADGPKAFSIVYARCLEILVQYPALSAIGFRYSFEMYTMDEELQPAKRLQTCYLIKPEHWHPRPEISTFEDFYTTAKLKAAGLLYVRYCLTGFSCPKVGSNQGGCQSFDRAAQAERELSIFQAEGLLAGVRHKPNSPWKKEPII